MNWDREGFFRRAQKLVCIHCGVCLFFNSFENLKLRAKSQAAFETHHPHVQFAIQHIMTAV